MENACSSIGSGYFCKCSDVFVPNEDLIDHLRLPLTHSISSVSLLKPLFENIVNSLTKLIQILEEIRRMHIEFMQRMNQMFQRLIEITNQEMQIIYGLEAPHTLNEVYFGQEFHCVLSTFFSSVSIMYLVNYLLRLFIFSFKIL